MELTRAPVRFCRSIVSSFADIAVPIPSSAMRPNTEPSSKGHLGSGVNSDIAKIQTTVRWKHHCGCLLNVHRDGLDAGDLLLPGHRWPLLMQLNALGVLHNDILAANDVRIVVAPVEDCWDWYSGIRLYCDADECHSVCFRIVNVWTHSI